MSVLDNQKDFYIKEKLQKDKIISQKADDVFNNFFKGDFNMEQNENVQTENTKEHSNTKAKNNKKYKKLVATAASVLVLFGAANVYAMTQGYENIFFMIKYLTTGEQTTITDINEILSDRYISISYEPIKIADGIKIQISNLQIKDNEAKLFVNVAEESFEKNTNKITPLNYKVYNSNNELLCSQESARSVNEEGLGGTYKEELNLNNFTNSDEILKLEIYGVKSNLITTIKINLETRTIEVAGEEEALEKIAEIDLKSFLGKVPNLYDVDWNVVNKDGLIILALTVAEGNIDFYDLGNNGIGYKVDDINEALESFCDEEVGDLPSDSDFELVKKDGEEYYLVRYGSGIPAPAECIDISSISYCGGLYTATYTYFFLGENDIMEIDINDFDIYQNTVTFTLNEEDNNDITSKFKLVSVEKPTIIKSAEDKEEGAIEGDAVIPDKNLSDKEFVKTYFEGEWGETTSNEILKIKDDMTFVCEYNGNETSRGTFTVKDYGSNDVPHIIFKYTDGTTYDFRLIQGSNCFLVSNDSEKVYEYNSSANDNQTVTDITNNLEGNISNTTKVDNYASTMSWIDYWAPGISFKYPEIFGLKEYGDYCRGSNPGGLSTAMSGKAIGVDPNTKEIIESDLTIAVYEPLHRYISDEEIASLENKTKLTTKQGVVWYGEYVKYEDGGTEVIYKSYEKASGDEDNYLWEYKISFTTDVYENYKVTNIINWFMGTIEFTSY